VLKSYGLWILDYWFFYWYGCPTGKI